MTATMLNCAVVATSRIAFGSHFASDVLFAAALTALAVWLPRRVAFGGS
jgi:membrane-associated phospholipid phosphatase